MSLKQLWAPWRMEFLTSAKGEKGDSGCVFCVLPSENRDRENLILHRGSRNFVIMNKYPYNNGHLMVVPNLHLSSLSKLPDEDLGEMMQLTKAATEILHEAYQPEGYNVGMNLGVSGGAGIKDHLHMHIVPRWLGDTNFMPVLAEAKAMPQHLEASYDQLHPLFRRLKKSL